jgi:3-oxoacyl-[acyl-carrier protein] reductase
MQVASKTIVITGAGRGIGRALAEHFAQRRAHLALFDLNRAELDESVAACRALGAEARAYVVNVASEEEVVSTFEQVMRDFGRCDGLINNAGILKDALLVKVKDGEIVGKMTLSQWQAVIDVNLTGVFLCGREAAAHMIRGGSGGVIVNISSISRAGNVGQTNYTAAKAGVASMTVVWARELARHGVRVGAIAPGFVGTSMVANMKPEILEKVIAPVPLKRLARADEIAHAASFIFDNDFYTGRCIEIDGGLRL